MVEKNTLTILSNVLLNIKENKLEIIATDLDIVFYDEIQNLKIIEAGNTTTSANVLFDILIVIPQGAEINFTLKSENKLSLKTKTPILTYFVYQLQIFQLLIIISIQRKLKLIKKFLSLLNKTDINF